MSQEKPKQLVGIPARPTPKLPQYTSLFRQIPNFVYAALVVLIKDPHVACQLPAGLHSCCSAFWCNARR